jgi:hypothetical protein
MAILCLLSNGWYKIEHITAGDKLYVAAMLIKHEYDFENDVLVNRFSENLMPDFQGRIWSPPDEGFPVHNKYGKKIFSIVPLDEMRKNTVLEIVIFFCYLFAFIILIQLLINAFQKLLVDAAGDPHCISDCSLVALRIRMGEDLAG